MIQKTFYHCQKNFYKTILIQNAMKYKLNREPMGHVLGPQCLKALQE